MSRVELRQLPAGFGETRAALHQVAFFVLGPVRYKAVGRMGLRAAPGGFGTPEFEGRVVRVEGDTIVDSQPNQIASQTLSSVRAAAEFVGIDYEVAWFESFHDPLTPIDPDEPLQISDDAARALGQWFNFGFEVLDLLRKKGTVEDDVSETQLWPEHFDPATELGNEPKGERASYGASPGDATHEEPYLYVAAWGDLDRSVGYWNEDSFNGASLAYTQLLSAADPVETGLEFLLEGYRILHST